MIDTNVKVPPSHAMKKNTLKYPDHFAVMVIFKDIPRKKIHEKSGQKIVLWNTNREGGWESYREDTSIKPFFNKISNGNYSKTYPDKISNALVR